MHMHVAKCKCHLETPNFQGVPIEVDVHSQHPCDTFEDHCLLQGEHEVSKSAMV